MTVSDLIRLLFFPRGLIALGLYMAIMTPWIIIKHLFSTPFPASWDLSLDLIVHAARYSFGNRDWKKARILFEINDQVERLLGWLLGLQTERVRRQLEPSSQEIDGIWIIEDKRALPNVQSELWRTTTVYFYCHGGGFGAGSSYTGLLAHRKVMKHHASFTENPIVTFAFNYPLAPEAKHPAQVEAALACYTWLVQHVGVSQIVLGGDSCGANIILGLYTELLKRNRETALVLPKAMILICPWLDVSLSHTPPHIQQDLSARYDFLAFSMLQVWRDNITPYGMHPRDPRLSPFFDLEPLSLPPGGMLVIYGSHEVFSPVCDEWIKSIRKQSPSAPLKVIVGVDMPHDFPISLHMPPSAARAKANRALLEMGRFIASIH